MSNELFELRCEGVLKFTGTENECYYKLQLLQGQSADYAMKYGGWTIEPKPSKWSVISVGTDCDGCSSDQVYRFQTKQEAEEFAESANAGSDGLFYEVINEEV